MSHTYYGDGHCRHAPKCIGSGQPDDRDPLGCCNCGTRWQEQNRRRGMLIEREESGLLSLEEAQELERLNAAADAMLAALMDASRAREVLGIPQDKEEERTP